MFWVFLPTKNRMVLLLWLTLWMAVCGCNVTKHLDTDKGERLLTKNSLKIKSRDHLGLSKRMGLIYETSSLYKLPPNSDWLGWRPKLAAHFYFKDKKSKFSNWVNKKFAEKPALYSEEAAQKTAANFQNYMRKKGYFNAVCSYNTTLIGNKKAKTTYFLDLGKQYTIKSAVFTSRDTVVHEILQAIKEESLIKPGNPVDGGLFDNEKIRITSELRNRGFAAFIPGYIEFNGDSTGHQVDVTIDVLPFNDSTNHTKYKIGNVVVFSSLLPELNVIRQDTTINGINYFSNEQQFFIKPKHLDKIIKTRPGDILSSANIDRTNRSLNTLSAFSFVSVRQRPDSLNKEVMNVDISYSPEEKYAYGLSPDINYTSSSNNTNLIGASVNAFFSQRNLFRGAELLSINLTGNMEFDVQKTSGSFIFSQEIKAQTDLTIPRFLDYFNIWRGLNKVKLGRFKMVDNKLYATLKEAGRAHIGLNYNNLSQIGFFKYDLFNASFGYTVNPGGTSSWNFNHVGIDLLQPELDPGLLQSKLLSLRFTDQLFTGFILRSFNYSLFTKPNKAGEQYSFRFGSDVSGLEVLALNSIFDKKKEWKLRGLPFGKFARFETTGTYLRSFTKELKVGILVSSGLVMPLDRNQPAPYVKQFFMGGPSSVRAWQIRELGPGSYYDATAPTNEKTSYYQASDFKFEFISEVRFPLFWWFKGAVFLDGGNIWEIWKFENTEPRRGAQLNWNSYKNIALGTGAGLRFDFGYSIIRFDWGIKLRRPYPNPGTGSYWVFWNAAGARITNWRDISNFNLAVGYPF